MIRVNAEPTVNHPAPGCINALCTIKTVPCTMDSWHPWLPREEGGWSVRSRLVLGPPPYWAWGAAPWNTMALCAVLSPAQVGTGREANAKRSR